MTIFQKQQIVNISICYWSHQTSLQILVFINIRNSELLLKVCLPWRKPHWRRSNEGCISSLEFHCGKIQSRKCVSECVCVCVYLWYHTIAETLRSQSDILWPCRSLSELPELVQVAIGWVATFFSLLEYSSRTREIVTRKALFGCVCAWELIDMLWCVHQN